MKKTSTTVKGLLFGFWVWAATACAFTEYGNRINGEHAALQSLERKREDAETRYVIVLNNLERYPGDPRMEKERDQVRAKIQDLDNRVEEQRQLFTRSVQEWEEKIIQDKIQQQMIEKTEKENAGKVEGEWNSSP